MGLLERLDRHNQRVVEKQNHDANRPVPAWAHTLRRAGLMIAVVVNLLATIGLLSAVVRGEWAASLLLAVLIGGGGGMFAASWEGGRVRGPRRDGEREP